MVRDFLPGWGPAPVAESEIMTGGVVTDIRRSVVKNICSRHPLFVFVPNRDKDLVKWVALIWNLFPVAGAHISVSTENSRWERYYPRKHRLGIFD